MYYQSKDSEIFLCERPVLKGASSVRADYSFVRALEMVNIDLERVNNALKMFNSGLERVRITLERVSIAQEILQYLERVNSAVSSA